MPEFLHPSVHSKITDNSFVFQTAAGSTVLFACGKAVKGPDNVLTRLTTKDEAKFIFGEPNMSLTGQTLYNVYNWLGAGGEVYFIRVLPDDAEYANLVLSIGLDSVTVGTVTTKTVFPIVSNVGSANAAGTSSASVSALQSLVSGNVGTPSNTSIANILGNGNTVPVSTMVYPLAAFYPYGRGKAYNHMGIILSPKDSLDSTYDFRTYSLSITVKDIMGADVVVDGPYTVSLERTAKDRSRESLFFASVLNKYSKFVKVVITTETETYDNRIEDIRSFVNDSDTINPLHLDFVYGEERSGIDGVDSIHNTVKFGTPSTTPTGNQVTIASAADLKDVSHLIGGTEGTWGDVTVGGVTYNFDEESLLVKAYSALTDSTVLDKKQFLFDVLLDANYSALVKNAMVEFASSMRGDCVALIDCGFQANPEQTIAFRRNSIGFSNFLAGVYAHDFVVYDEFTGENIKVTLPYFLAKKIPANDNQYGVHWSFSGPRRGVLSGFDQVNFFPNEIWKESLYKSQINYIEKDPKRINIATQLTSQTVNSALSNLNNVRALMRIKRDSEFLVDEYRDEFNDALTHESMSYSLNNYLQKWVSNRCCKSISGAVYASDYDRLQKIARVKVEMSFTGLIERIFLDFIVNR